MKKIIDIGYKVILSLTILFLGISFIGAIFFYVNRSNNYLNPIVLIIGTIIYLLLLYKVYNFIIKLDNRHKSIIVIILLALQFILLFISNYVISSIPKVDLLHILTEINSLNNTGKIINNTYFSVYPNNRFILILLYNIAKININNQILFGFVSCFSITVMSIFTYKTVKEVFNIDKGLLILFIIVTSPIFYLYVSYYYTDILMLPVSSIIIYLMVKNTKCNILKNNIIYGILIGILSIIGYKIRAVCIFTLIAYFIYIIITKKLKDILVNIIPIFIGLIITFSFINNIENNFFKKTNENQKFPMTHWIMMGFNPKNGGYYSQADYDYSFKAKDVSNRKELNIIRLKERLNKMGALGIGKHLIGKIITVWSKGDYSYQKYLDLVRDYNVSYKYLVEDKNIVINYLLQFSKIGILFLCIVSLIKLLKTNKKSFMAISLFGAFVFYLMWEVCPRYGLSFLPWLIILSAYSIDSFNFKLNNQKMYKYFKCIIFIITFILFICYFNKYTNTRLRQNVVAKDISNKVKLIELNKNKTIYQSLKLNSSFNTINIRMAKFNNKNNTFTFELLNDSKDTLYKKEIKLKDIAKDSIIIDLDKSYNKGIYYIKLSKTDSGRIKFYKSYKQEFDFYPEGNLIVNDKYESGDLEFLVSNYEKIGIYSKIEYIIIALLGLGIEYIVLFRKDCCYEK